MKIRVIKKDIDFGLQSHPGHCPVANAVKRKFKNKLINVYTCGEVRGIFINDKKYKLSNRLKYKIDKFDKNKEMVPFEFDLIRAKL